MNAMKKPFFIFVFAALLGAGCVAPESAFPSVELTKLMERKTGTAMPSWQDLGDGASRFDCPASACGVRLLMYRFNLDKYGFHIDNDGSAPLTVEGWSKKEGGAALVANGVYFDEKYQPTGMLVSDAIPANNRHYDYDKSAFLNLAPVGIVDTAIEPLRLKEQSFIEGAQSFPLLIKDGVTVALFKDAKAARRTATGIDEEGNIIFSFVPEDAITFADFAKLLSLTGVRWKNVLNLDGGTSTGFAARIGDWSETMNSIVQVPNVIVIEKK
jgi:uncharacterized protein YigE (DUF2233 family)